jgi:hypothetical protein
VTSFHLLKFGPQLATRNVVHVYRLKEGHTPSQVPARSFITIGVRIVP